MILDPLGYVPTEIALRTTIARNAFAAQPRRARRRRTHRRLVQWTVPTFPDGARTSARRHADGTA
ncbi:hypothetical protein [Aeromicrobium sp.]|uniref:hypothetical protein n=1 Tax=Aeromicrobium sp. TaxID=1871063 RepID=UPI003516F6F3